MAKQSLKDRLAKKRQDIKNRTESRGIVFIKEGVLRIRVLPVGSDEDFSREITHFYLGNTIKGVFSPATLGKSCPIMEAYKEFNGNKNKQDVAKLLTPKIKYVVPVIVYEDELGKRIDDRRSGQLCLIPNGIFGQMIDFFLDPELGDFTDPKNGYDLKIKRMGKGKTDTEYTITPARPSSIPAKWAKPVDLDAMVEKIIEPYEDIQDKLDTYLVELEADAELEEKEKIRPRKKKKTLR